MSPGKEDELGAATKVEHLTNGFGNMALGSRKQRRKSIHPTDERSARDPRDEAVTPTDSREQSQVPSQQYPAVDFDGLSWPSKTPRE